MMTKRSELERAVARATGESRRTIRRYGFQPVPDHPVSLAPNLALDCPGCGAAVPFIDSPQRLPELAECRRCETAYPYDTAELYLPEDAEPAAAFCA